MCKHVLLTPGKMAANHCTHMAQQQRYILLYRTWGEAAPANAPPRSSALKHQIRGLAGAAGTSLPHTTQLPHQARTYTSCQAAWPSFSFTPPSAPPPPQPSSVRVHSGACTPPRLTSRCSLPRRRDQRQDPKAPPPRTESQLPSPSKLVLVRGPFTAWRPAGGSLEPRCDSSSNPSNLGCGLLLALLQVLPRVRLAVELQIQARTG